MKPIRVLHCIFTTAVGGLEMGVVKLVNSLDPSRFEHGICAFTSTEGNGESCLDALTNPSCRYFQLTRREGNDLRLVAQLVRVIREFRPTVVHTRNWATYLEGGLAATLTATPVLVHGEHGTPSPGLWRHRWAYRLLARRTRVVVTVSEALAKLYRETCRSWATEVQTIHNGVDEARFRPAADPSEIRRALGLPASATIVGSVGRLVPVKGFDVLLEAMVLVAQQHPEAVLVLVGDGSERAALQAQADRLGIADRVRLVGHRTDVVPWYQVLDAYVNSSHSEGISNGILEAMSCGVPVVATHVGGNPEILRRAGLGGTLVPPKDSQALAAAVLEILRDQPSRQLRRAAVRQAILSHFSLATMVARYAALYQDTAGARPPRARRLR